MKSAPRTDEDHPDLNCGTGTEGKAAVTIAVYRLICKRVVELEQDYMLSMFAWSFTTMTWNLMARCISNASLMQNHLGFGGDCMEVVFAKHKGDTEGKNQEPKHCFANPFEPEICVFTSMACYLFTMGPREMQELGEARRLGDDDLG